MYFKFECEQCGKNLKVREEIAGRKARCPYCHATVTVPEPPEQSAEDPLSEIMVKTRVTPAPAVSSSASSSAASSVRRPRKPSANEGEDGTNIGLVAGGVLGAGLAVAFMALMLPMYKTYLGELFLQRGWVPPVLVLLMGWSSAILILKARKLKRQKESMMFDLLPSEIAGEINAGNVEQVVDHVRDQPAEPGESFLINRVLRGLEHFRARQSNPEVAGMMNSQSDIDATAVDSSYTLLKVFIWAIPILGFIGTVIGISDAVGGFSGSLQGAQDMEVMKSSLYTVTGGLSTAFDTTLIALVMSLLVMFPTSSMQKAEADLLNWVDEYCNENLLKRLNDGGQAGKEDATAIEAAVNAAMARQQAELKSWNAKLESIGDTLTRQVVGGWGEIHEQLQQEHGRNVVQMQEALAGLAERSQTAHSQAADSMQQAATSLTDYFATLQQGLTALNGVLERLGEQQVVIQQQEPKKKGWFFRRK